VKKFLKNNLGDLFCVDEKLGYYVQIEDGQYVYLYEISEIDKERFSKMVEIPEHDFTIVFYEIWENFFGGGNEVDV